MKIVLLRHGKPDIAPMGGLRANELHRWIASYNAAGIAPEHPPPATVLEKAADCRAHVCSDLPRSIESAALLNIGQPLAVAPIFRETGLPYSDFRFPRLPPNLWALFYRVLWLLGYSKNSESLRAARKRAARGAAMLIGLAGKYGSVLLVGHGLMNHFIAKELAAHGWDGPASPGRRYWGFGVYTTALRFDMRHDCRITAWAGPGAFPIIPKPSCHEKKR